MGGLHSRMGRPRQYARHSRRHSVGIEGDARASRATRDTLRMASIAETRRVSRVSVNQRERLIMHVFKIYSTSGTFGILTTVSEYTATEWLVAAEMQGCDFDYFYMSDPEN